MSLIMFEVDMRSSRSLRDRASRGWMMMLRKSVNAATCEYNVTKLSIELADFSIVGGKQPEEE